MSLNFSHSLYYGGRGLVLYGEVDVDFLADSSEGNHQRGLLAKVAAEVFADFDKPPPPPSPTPASIETMHSNPIPIIYQSGYLTHPPTLFGQ